MSGAAAAFAHPADALIGPLRTTTAMLRRITASRMWLGAGPASQLPVAPLLVPEFTK